MIRLSLLCNCCGYNIYRNGNSEGGSLVDILWISANSLGLISKSDPLIELDLLSLLEVVCDQYMFFLVTKCYASWTIESLCV